MTNGPEDEFGTDDDGTSGDATRVDVPRGFAIGQLARSGKALCDLGVTYLRTGIAFALGADGPVPVEVMEKTAETIHILNGSYRALRRVTVAKDNQKGTP
jgi:hypothetical protein